MAESQYVSSRQWRRDTRCIAISAMTTGNGRSATVIPIQSTSRLINPPDPAARSRYMKSIGTISVLTEICLLSRRLTVSIRLHAFPCIFRASVMMSDAKVYRTRSYVTGPVHAWLYTYGILANYQTGFGYKFTNGWYSRSDSTGRSLWTHPNYIYIYSSVTTERNRTKVSSSRTRSQWITERNMTSARLSVSKKLTFVFSSIHY